MLKISRVLVVALLPLSAPMSWAGDRNADAMVGGVLGGVIGSIVGSQIGGRDGAVVGAGIGAIAGVALTSDGGNYRRDRYDDRDGHDNRGGYRADYRDGYRDNNYRVDYRSNEHGRHDDYRPRFYRD